MNRFRHSPASSLSITLFGLLLSGCAVGPDYQKPDPPVAAIASYDSAKDTGETALPINWWTAFEDSTLDWLIEQSDDQNLTLEVARHRILEARAKYQYERGRSQPTLGVSAGINRSELSENGRNGTLVAMTGVRTTNQFSGGLDAAWELDLFGRNQHYANAAQSRLQVAEFSFVDLQNTIRAEVAFHYYHFRSANVSLNLLNQNLELRKEILDLEQSRLNAGSSNELNVSRARQSLLDLRKRKPSLEAARENSLLAIATLIPQNPNELREKMDEIEFSTPNLSHLFGRSISSELLNRRPDVRIAEQQLIAETAVLGIRTADMYPRFNLLGSLGQESIDSGDILDGASNLWNFGLGLSMPIFNGGRLESLKEAQQAKVAQALTNYEATMIAAIRDTECAIINVHYGKQLLNETQAAFDNATRTDALAQSRYDAGVLPLDERLSEQQRFYLAEEALELAKFGLAQNLINLGQSLAGEWTNPIP